MPLSREINADVTRADYSEFPLCVDLDGTLVCSDLLLESLVRLIRSKPWCLLLIPVWVLRGRAAFKAEVAGRARLDPQFLPYNRRFLEWLVTQRHCGRRIWLCTGANESIASSIADHLKIFDGVLASTDRMNFTGKNKAAKLTARFGYRGFDYCGNERCDIHVWKLARGAIVVGGRGELTREAEKYAAVLHSFPASITSLRALVRALRPQHWAKNLLVFTPWFTSLEFYQPNSMMRALLATIAFCLCASSIYLLNDLLDLDADRAHWVKSGRPFAAGDLSILVGICASLLLVAAAFALALSVSTMLMVTLACYAALASLYSWLLKGMPIVHELTIAALLMLRIIAGAATISVQPSSWLLWFCIPLFISMSFAKRYSDVRSKPQHECARAGIRDYTSDDLPILQTVGIAAGCLGVVVLAAYAQSPTAASVFSKPVLLWPVCILVLYWNVYLWIKARRQEWDGDPLMYALKDRTSQIVGALAAIMTWIAV